LFGARGLTERGDRIERLLELSLWSARFRALLTASFITDMEPWMRWSLGLIAGGGAAAAVQGATVSVRSLSGITTLGLGNPIVSAGELVGATTLSILAVLVPLAALALLVLLAWFVCTRVVRRRNSPEAVRVLESPSR
jgi:hypothetical protein